MHPRELIDDPARAFVPFDGLEVIDTPKILQLITPLFPRGGFNGISRTQLDDAEADEVIARVVADYRARDLSFRWSVMPDSTPHDLEARLARHGLVRTETAAMARDPRDAGLVPTVGLSCDEVRSDEHYSATMAAGWGSPVASLKLVHAAALADPQRRQRLFLARVDGEPAGVAAMMLFPRSAYLLGGVVLRKFRQRGVYRELVRARLELAASLNVPMVTSHALASTSAPLLERWGFREHFRFGSFSPPR